MDALSTFFTHYGSLTMIKKDQELQKSACHIVKIYYMGVVFVVFRE